MAEKEKEEKETIEHYGFDVLKAIIKEQEIRIRVVEKQQQEIVNFLNTKIKEAPAEAPELDIPEMVKPVQQPKKKGLFSL